MDNLYKILEESAERHPDNTALVFLDKKITYKKLKDTADRLANGFLSLGLKKGDRIGVLLPNGPHFTMVFFALLKIGVTVIPISIHYKSDEIHHRLSDSEAKGVVYWKGYRQRVHTAVESLEHCSKFIVLGEQIESGEVELSYLAERYEPLTDTVEPDPDDSALIVYTSGTTGVPKGACLTHKNLLSNVSSVNQVLRISDTDTGICVLPLSHPLGHSFVMCNFIYAGASLVLMTSFEARAVLDTVSTERATFFFGVPNMFRELAECEESEEEDISSLKYCISSGDSLTQEIKDKFENRFNTIILEAYGLTEASPIVSINDPVREAKAGSIGLPVPGVDMMIVDENDQDVLPGQVGEVIVKGPNVMKGYLNKPVATEEALRGGWLRTGDFARLDESGYGIIVVRKKNVIVKSGFNVYPREVEKFLQGHSKIKEVVVVGVPDPFYGEEIHACVVLQPGKEADQQEIIEYSQERMAAYKCPKKIHFYSSLPKGPTGRILRDQVKKNLMDKMEGSIQTE